MSHLVAPSPLGDINGNFAHDAKGHSRLPSNSDSRTPSHACPFPARRYTPDFENESGEEMTRCITPDPRSTPPVPAVPSAQGPPGLDRPGPRVRFRSRVRIAAGRRRQLSDGSPVSSSPSSSISAPLRTHYTGSNGWSPLGTRVGSQRLRSATHAPVRGQYANGGGKSLSEDGDWDVWEQDARPAGITRCNVDEHTRLMTSTARHFYTNNRYVHDSYDGERRWKEQLMNEAFGKWPERLLNRHWWWWHVEPVLCCLCYPDDEE